MLYSALMLMMSSAFLMLRLSPAGSFPKPLTAEEEREALEAMKHGDSEARDRLIEHNLRLVAHNEILMYLRSMRRKAAEVSLADALEADEDGTGLSLMDLLAEDSDLDERLVLAEQAQKVREAVGSTLDKREQKVIRLRYGLDGKAPMTQRETAEILGISRSYISRIEKKALEKLRLKLGN